MMDYTKLSRYAKVLFNLDTKTQDLEKRLLDFDCILRIMDENPELIRFLQAPQVRLQEKKKLLADLFKDTLDQTFIHFLMCLIPHERFMHLKTIQKAYTHLVNKYSEKWQASMVTAVALDKDCEETLTKKLETLFHKKIHLKPKIDPKILGGVILIVSNEMLDLSLKGRLKNLQEALLATPVYGA